jgi:glucose/arabinose dehydrogenase
LKSIILSLIILVMCSPLIFTEIQQAHGAYSKATPEEGGPTFKDQSLKAIKIVEGLDHPTSMAFLGPDDILVLQKNDGTVHRIVNGKVIEKPLLQVEVSQGVEWGMLGIAVSKGNNTQPNNPTHVFLYYTQASGNVAPDSADSENEEGSDVDSIYRYDLVGDALINPKLLMNLPANMPSGGQENNHVGGKLEIGPDNNLYVTIGDVGGRSGQAQNIAEGDPLDGTSGILRMTQDGLAVPSSTDSPPPPQNKQSEIKDFYYAYGIRNSFGFDFDPVTKKLWDTENGGTANDEINLVDKGFNSGWVKLQGLAQQGFNPQSELVQFPNSFYRDPDFVWEGTIGVTFLQFLQSSKLGQQYANTMFVGDVNTGSLYNFQLNKDRNGLVLQGGLVDKVANTDDDQTPIILGSGFGVITDIKEGPDGFLYILNYSGDIYKIYK